MKLPKTINNYSSRVLPATAALLGLTEQDMDDLFSLAATYQL